MKLGAHVITLPIDASREEMISAVSDVIDDGADRERWLQLTAVLGFADARKLAQECNVYVTPSMERRR